MKESKRLWWAKDFWHRGWLEWTIEGVWVDYEAVRTLMAGVDIHECLRSRTNMMSTVVAHEEFFLIERNARKRAISA